MSNYSIGQIDDLIEGATGGAARRQPDPVEPLPLRRPPAGRAHRSAACVLEGYSPLKGTRLRDRTLAEIAAKYGVTPAQVVLRWHLDNLDRCHPPKRKANIPST